MLEQVQSTELLCTLARCIRALGACNGWRQPQPAAAPPPPALRCPTAPNDATRQPPTTACSDANATGPSRTPFHSLAAVLQGPRAHHTPQPAECTTRAKPRGPRPRRGRRRSTQRTSEIGRSQSAGGGEARAPARRLAGRAARGGARPAMLLVAWGICCLCLIFVGPSIRVHRCAAARPGSRRWTPLDPPPAGPGRAARTRALASGSRLHARARCAARRRRVGAVGYRRNARGPRFSPAAPPGYGWVSGARWHERARARAAAGGRRPPRRAARARTRAAPRAASGRAGARPRRAACLVTAAVAAAAAAAAVTAVTALLVAAGRALLVVWSDKWAGEEGISRVCQEMRSGVDRPSPQPLVRGGGRRAPNQVWVVGDLQARGVCGCQATAGAARQGPPRRAARGCHSPP